MINNDLYARLSFIVLPIEDEDRAVDKELLLDFNSKDLYIKNKNGNIKVGESKLKELIDGKVSNIIGVETGETLESLALKINGLSDYKDFHKNTLGNDIDTISKLLILFNDMSTSINILSEIDKLQDKGDQVLVSNNFTDILKKKLEGIDNEANRYTHPIEKQCNYQTKLLSVNNRTGVVIVTKEDLGLGLVEPGANLYEHPLEKQCGRGVISIFGRGGREFINYSVDFNSGSTIDKDGRLYVWGKYYTKKIFDDSKYYKDVDISQSVITAAIFRDGTLTVNSDIDKVNTDTPTNSGYEKISCGVSHVAALREGEVIVWGAPDDNLENVPKDSNIKDVISYQDRMIILKDDGVAKIWGYNTPISDNETVPDEKFRNVCIGVGQYAGITDKGQIKIWGKSNDILTGALSGNTFIDIALSERCGVALRDTGKLIVWGDKNDPIYKELPTKGGYKSVKCGPNHCTVLSTEGVLTTWGDDTDNQVTNTPSAQVDINVEKHHLGLPFLNNFPIAEDIDIQNKVNDKYITTPPANIALDRELGGLDIDSDPLQKFNVTFTTDPSDSVVDLLIRGKWVVGKTHNDLYPGRYMYRAVYEDDKASGTVVVANSNINEYIQVKKYEILFNMRISVNIRMKINNQWVDIPNRVRLYPGEYEFTMEVDNSYTRIRGTIVIDKDNIEKSTYVEYHSQYKSPESPILSNKYTVHVAPRRLFSLNINTSPSGATVRNNHGVMGVNPFYHTLGSYRYFISKPGYYTEVFWLTVDRNKSELIRLTKWPDDGCIVTFVIPEYSKDMLITIDSQPTRFLIYDNMTISIAKGSTLKATITSEGYSEYIVNENIPYSDTHIINVSLVKN